MPILGTIWLGNYGNRPDHGPPDPNLDVLDIGNITQVEVLQLIDTVSVSKSSGLDNISSRFSKDFLRLAAKEVTQLYNDILGSGVFLDKWKIATVTPIPKVSNATEPNELRPISLLPIPGKRLEKHVTIEIQNYLKNNNLFVENQNGFRWGKSTASALARFLDDIVNDVNDAKTWKPFDTLNHEILLDKLRQVYGRNYLTNGKQKIK